MARYRHKSPEDLVWNRIRRTITSTLDMAIRDAREEALNEMLWQAWEDYTRALSRGEIREVESKYKQLATTIVRDMIAPMEIAGARVADD